MSIMPERCDEGGRIPGGIGAPPRKSPSSPFIASAVAAEWAPNGRPFGVFFLLSDVVWAVWGPAQRPGNFV